MSASMQQGVVRQRMAAGVGALLGVQAMVASTLVFLGIKQPTYVVLRSLVAYNGLAGVTSLLTGVALWRKHPRALQFVTVVALAHSIVLLVLLASRFADVAVATHSVKAMVVRSLVWWGIFAVARSVKPA